jgi:Trypsin
VWRCLDCTRHCSRRRSLSKYVRRIDNVRGTCLVSETGNGTGCLTARRFCALLAQTDFYGNTVLVGPVDKDGTSGGLAVYRSVIGDKVVHPQFQVTDRGAHSYDFVLFKIQKVQQDNIRPVSLNADPNGTAAGTPATMVGFGYTGWNETESPRLLKASVTTIATADCEQRYGRRPGFFDESAVCTLGTTSTSCFGDSGGPLLDSKGSLIGVVSFGTTCKSSRALSRSAICGSDSSSVLTAPFLLDCDPKYPSGSMRVASAMPWIVATACNLTDAQVPFCPTPLTPPTTTRSCPSISKCAAIVKGKCGCPSSRQRSLTCAAKVVNNRCCSSSSTSRTRYALAATRTYRKSCGFTS